MNLQAIFKTVLPHVIALAIIMGVMMIYYAPQLNGKMIAGGDVVSSEAWNHHVSEWQKKTGDTYNWNPSMFSGMPWGLLVLGKNYNLLRPLDRAAALWTPSPMGRSVQAALLTYIALIILGISPWISLFGALLFGFNVNYLILLEAGHNAKLNVLSYFPLIISSLILCYQNKWKIGAPFLALSTSLALAKNHPQMVYYLLIVLVVFSFVYGVIQIVKSEGTQFFKYAAIAFGAALIGGASNYSQLASSRSFAEDTMRGAPILSKDTGDSNTSSNVEGLNWNYAMNWSNDLKDISTLLIPRVVGGSSYEEVSETSEIGRLLKQNNAPKGSDNTYQAYMYWGDLPSTSGPYYSGILIIIIAFMGFKFLDKQLMYGMTGALLIIIMLSMGKNLAFFNQTLFDNLPYFNKWRAPSSAITLLPIFLIILFAMVCQKIVDLKNRKEILKPLLISTSVFLATCLAMALFGPGMFEFEGPRDSAYAPSVLEIFKKDRANMLSSDAYRSLAIGLSGSLALFLYIKGTLKRAIIPIILIGGISLIDAYMIGKRHLDSDNFEKPTEFKSNFSARPVDDQIKSLEPKGRGHYRVLDLGAFQSAIPSYHHNTIGGYHPAKLQRYQDVIDKYIAPGRGNVLSMLNAKYIVNPKQELQINQQAYGNAWFIKNVTHVNSADEEFDSLSNLDTRNSAVLNTSEFKGESLIPGDGSGSIELMDYAPDHLTYSSEVSSAQVAVFSEIWYDEDKGLRAFIDNEEVEFVRVNYILRALQIPAGKHKVEFVFEAQANGAPISLISSLLILASILYLLFTSVKDNILVPQTVVEKRTISKTKRKKK